MDDMRGTVAGSGPEEKDGRKGTENGLEGIERNSPGLL